MEVKDIKTLKEILERLREIEDKLSDCKEANAYEGWALTEQLIADIEKDIKADL